MKCNNCGYEFKSGEDGRHSCSDVLKGRLDELKEALKNIISDGKEAIEKDEDGSMV